MEQIMLRSAHGKLHSRSKSHEGPLLLDFHLRSPQHNDQNGMTCINLWKKR